jgi:cation diffusion facilitator CzcD-associated flavoprotein CzcO
MMDVAIIGAGFAGICAGIHLKKANKSFVILEKSDGVGGTWRDNHYPGCACDVPSHLYSFSFAQNPRWTRMYAPQSEILEYLERVTDEYGLRPSMRFGKELRRARWDGAAWQLELGDGEKLAARWLVAGVGALSRPSLPDIPGLDRFQGKMFHSARWDHSYDLDGKTVAVVGTGASAIQFVPQIVPRVGKLHLFQRTPPWVLPRPDRAITPRERKWFAALPFTQRAYRYWIYWASELRVCGFTIDPRLMKLVARVGRWHLAKQIPDRELRKKLTPNYLPGCKRVLMANDYYPALAQPHVEVVTDSIREITPRGVVTEDGRERAVDAILCGTGFSVSEYLAPMEVIGRDGVDLNQRWRDGAEAHLGTTVAGFPNLFILAGPNTGLGHSSMVFMIESQTRYLLDCMRVAGDRTAEVRVEAQAKFNRKLQPRLDHTVWSSGCRSWYLDKSGKNVALWPGFTFEFWLRTRRIARRDYHFREVAGSWPAVYPYKG